jgi:hypothetical protein
VIDDDEEVHKLAKQLSKRFQGSKDQTSKEIDIISSHSSPMTYSQNNLKNEPYKNLNYPKV